MNEISITFPSICSFISSKRGLISCNTRETVSLGNNKIDRDIEKVYIQIYNKLRDLHSKGEKIFIKKMGKK
jgi:hypothetical protein